MTSSRTAVVSTSDTHTAIPLHAIFKCNFSTSVFHNDAQLAVTKQRLCAASDPTARWPTTLTTLSCAVYNRHKCYMQYQFKADVHSVRAPLQTHYCKLLALKEVQ
eukprot:18892-Heterococcus_DN1.PRE.2